MPDIRLSISFFRPNFALFVKGRSVTRFRFCAWNRLRFRFAGNFSEVLTGSPCGIFARLLRKADSLAGDGERIGGMARQQRKNFADDAGGVQPATGELRFGVALVKKGVRQGQHARLEAAVEQSFLR